MGTGAGEGVCVVSCLAVDNRLQWVREEKGLAEPDPLHTLPLIEKYRP